VTGEPWLGREPRTWQARAVGTVIEAMRKGDRRPLVHACTGAGKSVVIAELAAKCKGPVLVSTPSQYLTDQLGATLEQRCPGEVGKAYQHEWTTDRRIVVTCQASMPALLAERRDGWACWIVDEAHRFESDVARDARPESKVAIGLTATPFRADTRGLSFWDRLVFSYTSHEAVRDGVLVPWRVIRWEGNGDDNLDRMCLAWVDEFDGPGVVDAADIEDAEAFSELCPGTMPIHSRLSKAEQDRRIGLLRDGTLRALVHVRLLAEGVDFPWLRNLVLRVPIASPVQLVQRVGRVIRAHEGKSRATLYDPHDLLGDLGLVHVSRLEDAQRGEEGNTLGGAEWTIPELEQLAGLGKLPKPRAVKQVEGWVTDVIGLMRGAGIAPPPTIYDGGKWRTKRATDKQLASLVKMKWAVHTLNGDEHRDMRHAIKWLIAQPNIRSGTASDLGGILRVLADGNKASRGGGPPFELPFALPPVMPPAGA
jgi:superfamily II DNA or RNA helicase